MIRIKLADDVKTKHTIILLYILIIFILKSYFHQEQVWLSSGFASGRLWDRIYFLILLKQKKHKKSDRSLQSQHSQHGTEDCYKACLI